MTESRPGPLSGITVVELASDLAAAAGKMLGDLGADVILVEPPGGHPTRLYGPFVDDRPDPEKSLWFWHYNTSKRGVALDLDGADGAAGFRALVAGADVVLEAEPPGRLAALGLDYADLSSDHGLVVWTSVTPFGRDSERSAEPATDLTLLAGGGPVWCCGYDDHELPPVRGAGGQAMHTAGLWAVEGILAALVWRGRGGRGQLLDVSAHAALNVTTEAATYEWLVAGATVQRQTGRHAAPHMTMDSQVLTSDGRYVNTGVPPRSAREFQAVLDLLDELGLRDDLPEAVFLERGVELGSISFADARVDPEVGAIFGAGREALSRIAERIPASEFFTRLQDAGMACGVIYSPEEVLADPHFVARGFPVTVHHDDLDRDVVYPGAPFSSPTAPWRISRRAPRLGEHDAELLGRTD